MFFHAVPVHGKTDGFKYPGMCGASEMHHELLLRTLVCCSFHHQDQFVCFSVPVSCLVGLLVTLESSCEKKKTETPEPSSA